MSQKIEVWIRRTRTPKISTGPPGFYIEVLFSNSLFRTLAEKNLQKFCVLFKNRFNTWVTFTKKKLMETWELIFSKFSVAKKSLYILNVSNCNYIVRVWLLEQLVNNWWSWSEPWHVFIPSGYEDARPLKSPYNTKRQANCQYSHTNIHVDRVLWQAIFQCFWKKITYTSSTLFKMLSWRRRSWWLWPCTIAKVLDKKKCKWIPIPDKLQKMLRYFFLPWYAINIITSSQRQDFKMIFFWWSRSAIKSSWQEETGGRHHFLSCKVILNKVHPYIF